MAKSVCTIKVKRPHQAVYVKNYKNGDKLDEDIKDIMNETVSRNVIEGLQAQAYAARMMNLHIIAVFFQRVVSRTPIDEDYWVRYKSGKTENHKRDENSCKLDWYVEYRRHKYYVTEMIESLGDVFETYNDSTSILAIESWLDSHLRGKTMPKTGRVTATIGNDNPHFAVLEYGGIKGSPNIDSSTGSNPPSLLSGEEGQKHQMKNKRSIQAPYGMLRITEAELESIVQSSKTLNYGQKFQKDKSGKTRKPQTIKKLMNILKKSGKFSLDELGDLL